MMQPADNNSRWNREHSRRRGDGTATGVFLVLIGAGILIHKMNPDIPDWIFSWKTFLIALGIYLGYKENFRLGGWIAPIIIGVVFIVRNHYENLAIANYLWPIAIIGFGLGIVFKNKLQKNILHPNDQPPSTGNDSQPFDSDTNWSSEDVIEAVNIFSGSKKINISKNFKGGEITNIFGGSEINLSKADLQGQSVLEITCIFGGTKLIVPADWNIQQNAVAIFGGVDDKRPITGMHENPSKTLIIKGTVIMGGIDIRSF